VRLRIATVLTATAVVVGTFFAVAGTAGASRAPQFTHKGTAAAKPMHVDKAFCSQLDNDNGVGIVSQNFETTFDAYDSYGADDCKTKRKKTIHTVTAIGVYFNGSGPASSETVTVYNNAAGLPGSTLATQTQVGADAGGTFTITLSPGITMKRGKHWISVVANMNFSSGGEWGWNTNNTQKGYPSAWENPGGGFSSTGCTSWKATTTCIPAGEGPDFAYALS
jgi:hypothetical protein